MNKTDKIKKQINQILNSFVPLKDASEKFEQEKLRSLGIDSIIFVQIIVKLEEEFNISFSDEMLLLDRTETVNDLYELIYNLMGEA